MNAFLKRAAFAAVAAFALSAIPAHAEVGTVRLAKQYGISYLPMTVMQEKQLIEKQAKAMGLDLKTEWLRFTGGSGMNEALLSGNLDIAAGGVGPMLTLWGKTRNNLKVRGLAALNVMPLYLVSVNPNVKTIKDLTSSDKIALPAVKTSIQAVTLQMAAEKAFGEGQSNKLDQFTVSMGHPDAMVNMLGGKSEINAHFGSSPFQELELKDPKAHKVLDSYEVLGGPHTFNVIWAADKFVTENPKVAAAVVAALKEADEMIKKDPVGMAKLWIEAEKVKIDPATVEAIITSPQVEWTTTPKKVLNYLDYMNRAGLVSASTKDWHDLFFPIIHGEQGS